MPARRPRVQRDIANLVSAQKQVELLKAEITQADRRRRARALPCSAQAELNLGYTTITAPIDGVVGNRTLRVGQFVQAGTQLMSLVPATGAYVVANFKETQLTDVHAGQKVDIASRHVPGQDRCTAMSIRSRPPAARNSRCCRRTTPPAISPRWCSASPSRSRSTATAIELRPGMSVIPTIETLSHQRRRATLRQAKPQASPTSVAER